MGSIKIDFTMLENAVNHLEVAEQRTRSYGEALTSNNLATLEGITGGCTGNVATAYTSIESKGSELAKEGGLADRFAALSGSLSTLATHAQEADTTLTSAINGYAETAITEMGISVSDWDYAWSDFTAGIKEWLNESELGQWINDACRNVSDFFERKWDELQEWYAFNGGEYICNIGLAVLGVAAAVFTILTAGVGLLAIVAIVGAACAIFNSLFQIGSNIAALCRYKDDPAWARRYGDNTSLSNLVDDLRNTGTDNVFVDALDFLGGLVDVTSTICAIVDFTDFSTKMFTKFTGRQTMFQTYLGYGGMVDSYFVRMGDKADSVFDPTKRKWFLLGENGETTDIEVDFSRRNANTVDAKFDIRKGLSELRSNGNDGWNELKDAAKYDFRARWNSIKAQWNMWENNITVLNRSNVSTGYKLNYIATEGMRFVDDTVKTGFNSYFKGVENWKQGVGRVWKDVMGTIGVNGIQGDYKALEYRRLQNFKIGNVQVGRRIGEAAFVGSEIKKGMGVIENIDKILSGDIREVLQTTKKFDKAFGFAFASETN